MVEASEKVIVAILKRILASFFIPSTGYIRVSTVKPIYRFWGIVKFAVVGIVLGEIFRPIFLLNAIL